MKRLCFVAFCGVTLVCGFVLAGCAPQKVAQVEFPGTEPLTSIVSPSRISSEMQDEGMVPREILPESDYEDQLFRRIFLLNASGQAEKRLAVYDKKLSEWYELDEQMTAIDLDENRPQGWYGCLLQLEQIVEGYSRLRDFVRADGQNINQGPAGGDQAGYWKDIDYLESNCDEVFKAASIGTVGWVKQFSSTAAEQMEVMVQYYADNNMPNEAMQAYLDLVTVYPDHSVDTKTTKAYVLSLLRTGQPETAVSALQEIVEGLGAAEGIPLKTLLADLLLVTGRAEEAKAQYQSLNQFFASFKKNDLWVVDQLAMLENIDIYSEEMTAFMSVLQAYIAFDGKRVPGDLKRGVMQLEIDFPTSMLASRARHLLWQAEEEAGTWVGKRLVDVDNLVEEKEYRKAVTILEELMQEDLSPEVRRVVEKTKDDVVMAELEEQKAQQLLIEQTQAMQWDSASKLLGLRQYDEAITAFSLLIDTEYELKAREKIKEAASLAATDMRRQAANLFVKARKTFDPEQKKNLIIESWQMLTQIPIKYPNVDILDKVLENIKILEQQIRILDPSLLEEISHEDDPLSEEE